VMQLLRETHAHAPTRRGRGRRRRGLRSHRGDPSRRCRETSLAFAPTFCVAQDTVALTLSGLQAARRNVYEVGSPWTMEGMTNFATSVHHAGCKFAREHWSTSHEDASCLHCLPGTTVTELIRECIPVAFLDAEDEIDGVGL